MVLIHARYPTHAVICIVRTMPKRKTFDVPALWNKKHPLIFYVFIVYNYTALCLLCVSGLLYRGPLLAAIAQ